MKSTALKLFALGCITLLNACSMAQMTVRMSMPMIEGGMTAMNRESDLTLAYAAMPANIELMEGMLVNDPGNAQLRAIAAQAYYGLAFGFVEDEDKPRAARFYYRGFLHGKRALLESGLQEKDFNGPLDTFEKALEGLDKNDLPALFWTTSNWAKWIDLNRDKAASLIQMPKVVMLMQRAYDLDENFFMAGPHLFFAVYYGSRAPMLGGNYQLSQQHFDKARAFNQNKLLMVDLLQAQYLDRQQFNQADFHRRLENIINAPDDLYPDQTLVNMIAKQKARQLLNKEDEWF